MRHTPFFDEIVNRCDFIRRLMNSLGEIEDHIFGGAVETGTYYG
jgi:hypothetical protein